jgi:hypothetical protein
MSTRYSYHQWKHIGGVVAAFTSEGVMPDDAWDAMCRDLATLPIKGYIGTTTGPVEVSSRQRKLGVDTKSARDLPTAVVSESRVIIGLVTAASWLGAKIKAFAWKDLHAATKYLGATHSEQIEIIAAINHMREKAARRAPTESVSVVT